MVTTPGSETGGPTEYGGESNGGSGLFSATGIRALLASGAALVITSAYLFVRSYWFAIPDEWKFSGLAFLTALLYGVGLHLMGKSGTPRTARTLLTVSLFILPFNVRAADLWLFGNSLSAAALIAAAGGLLGLASLGASFRLPNGLLGFMTGVGLYALAHHLPAVYKLSLQMSLALTAGAVLATLAALFVTEGDTPWRRGFSVAAGLATFWVLGHLIGARFFLADSGQLVAASAMALLGGATALEARRVHPVYARLAGGLLMGAGALILRHFHQPVYTYGYFFIPAGFLALLRAWTFERDGKSALARPYFHWGQMAIAGSLLTVLPVFTQGPHVSLFPTLGVLMIAMAAYAAAGAFYRQSAYSYVGGLVLLLFVWTFVWGRGLDFASATLLFTMAACGFLVMGAIGAKTEQEILEGPFLILGLGTLTVAIALLAGRWGQELLSTGRLIPDLPPEQTRAGLWTGGLSVAAYGFLAALRKKPAFLYPALVSATWVYICFLEMNGVTIGLVHAGWIVAASLALHYAFKAAGSDAWARCFSLWGEMVAVGLALAAVVLRPPEALTAVALAGVAFLPGLFLGRSDLVQGFLMALYAGHSLVFRQMQPAPDPALYGLHLIPVNCAVVFLRALMTFRRPDAPVEPFRVTALFFSLLSLGLTFPNPHLAWQALLAYGLLAIGASVSFYGGRFLHVGGVLLLAGSEMFLRDQGIQRLELYLAPVGLYLLALGFARRGNRSLRDFFYGAAVLALFVPASIQSLVGSWEWHGVYLGLTSAVVLILGLHQRSRVLALPAFVVLIANALIQSRGFFLNVPQWIYLGLGGLALLVLGGIFEFRREMVLKVKDRLADAWEAWD